jgi:Tfp pilus assembly protein PilN
LSVEVSKMGQARPLDINILPQRYRPAQVQSSLSIVILVGAALLFGLMPAYALLSRARRDTAALEARLEQVQADLAQSQAGAGELESVIQQIDQTREQLAQLEAQLATVGEGRPPRSEGIAAIAGSLAGAVELHSISQDGSTFVILGRADNEALVLNYVNALETRVLNAESGRKFASVRVLSIVDSAEKDSAATGVVFSIEAEQ